ncbi:MAG: hypothetical protein QM610_00650 [Chitinophagaceae bacterium]
MPSIIRNATQEARSEEMEEIIGIVPHWIIRWGIAVLFLVAILGLVISNIIKYPETVNCSVTVMSKDQPGKVNLKKNDPNMVFRFLVDDGSVVKPGDTLLTVTNQATGKVSPTITPMSGTIYFTTGNSQADALNQTIWVVPPSSLPVVKINYSDLGAGNVKVGQEVKISLDDFPENEYGFVTGKVQKILPMQIQDSHEAVIAVDSNQLITSLKKKLPVLPIMKGNGEIHLSNKSIFRRIVGSIL